MTIIRLCFTKLTIFKLILSILRVQIKRWKKPTPSAFGCRIVLHRPDNNLTSWRRSCCFIYEAILQLWDLVYDWMISVPIHWTFLHFLLLLWNHEPEENMTPNSLTQSIHPQPITGGLLLLCVIKPRLSVWCYQLWIAPKKAKHCLICQSCGLR